MQVVTWNMAYNKPGRYKATQNRRRQWALLGALSPDIALLQECRPDDLQLLSPNWMAEEYAVVSNAAKGKPGSAVLARKELLPAPIDLATLPEQERRMLRFFNQEIAVAQLTAGGSAMNVASAHTLAGEVSNPAITDEDHALTRRPSKERARYNDVAASALSPFTKNSSFIVGGDWNVALLFDTTAPATAPGASEFFTARQVAGWHHALRKFYPEEVRTYLENSSKAYELDHIFTDAGLHDRLTDCYVFAEPSLQRLSDHAPVVASFAAIGLRSGP